MKIAIDAFGGDNAPLEIIRGTVLAKKEFDEEFILTGSVETIKECAAQSGLSLDGIELVEAPLVMDMHDEAKAVVKSKADSSMGVGLRLVADGKADAFVTAGPTGATLMGATLLIKRLKGVRRPALGTVIPGVEGNYMLMDCGANVECQPEMLEQFGVLGSVYMKKVYGIENPKVGLANNGAEDSKGTDMHIQAHKLLSDNKAINFMGNIEGRDIPFGKCQVVVADGFSGNMILKVTEGSFSAVFSLLKGVFMKNLCSKFATLMLKKSLKEFREKYNHDTVGGAPFIGLNKPVIKAHGSSGANAFKNAIAQAIKWHKSGVTEEIQKTLNTEH